MVDDRDRLTHADQYSKTQLVNFVEQLALRGEIPMSFVDNMFDTNPGALTGSDHWGLKRSRGPA